jgi:hypothetical protein
LTILYFIHTVYSVVDLGAVGWYKDLSRGESRKSKSLVRMLLKEGSKELRKQGVLLL